jgi:hypothetical protein
MEVVVGMLGPSDLSWIFSPFLTSRLPWLPQIAPKLPSSESKLSASKRAANIGEQERSIQGREREHESSRVIKLARVSYTRTQALREAGEYGREPPCAWCSDPITLTPESSSSTNIFSPPPVHP